MSEGRQFAPRKSIGNWAGYNEGLKKRYDITVHFEDASVFEKPEATGDNGRPQEYSDGYIEPGLMLKSMRNPWPRGMEKETRLPPTIFGRDRHVSLQNQLRRKDVFQTVRAAKD